MARIYKKHGSLFKSRVALETLKEKKTVAELCQEYSISASQIFAWKSSWSRKAIKSLKVSQKQTIKQK
jgi:transposase-like protein